MEDDARPDGEVEKVGHKRPPSGSRFAKGQSGNLKGRPRGRHRNAPYEGVLGQAVIVRDGTVERKMSAAEAFMLHMAKRGLEGDGSAGRAMMIALEEIKGRTSDQRLIPTIIFSDLVPGSVNVALEALHMARKLDPYRPTARMMLEPWIVEAALVRLGDRQLTCDQQRVVLAATRTPHKVAWPDWWERDLRDRK